jgi:hypothetical protein
MSNRVLCIAMFLAVVAVAARPVSAQARMDASPASWASAERGLQHQARASSVEGASFGSVATGTILGAVIGGAVLGAAGAALGALDSSDSDFISASAILGVMGGGLGYALGAPIGARRAASVNGRRAPLAPVILTSLLSGAGAALLASRIGSMSDETDVMDYGAVAGALVVHLGVTSLVAQRLARSVRD